MEQKHIYIVLIIVLSGLLTGITNFLISFDPRVKRSDNRIKLASFVSLSLCASLTVPLFLQIISNNILSDLTFRNALIFGGFCVIAGFFSQRYLDDLYAKLKTLEQKVESQKEVTRAGLEETARKADEINKKVEDLEESIEEVDSEMLPMGLLETLALYETEIPKADLTAVARALASSKYSARTIAGIEKETNISREQINILLEYLQNAGFTEGKLGSDGKTYWRLLKYPIKIYSANYGVVGKYADVSLKIKEMIGKGQYFGLASHDFFGIMDPAPGIFKELKVHYRIHGKEKEIIAPEGSQFRIE